MFGSFKAVMAAMGSPTGQDFATRNAPAAAPADGTVAGFANALGGGTNAGSTGGGALGALGSGGGDAIKMASTTDKEDEANAAPDPLAGLQMNKPKIDMVKLMQALRARADLGIA